MIVQMPLHELEQESRPLTLSAVASSTAAFIIPALVRRLAEPGQGASAALAFLSLHATQRGPGWTQQALPQLLEWLAAPYVTASPYRLAYKPTGPSREAGGRGGLARTVSEPGYALELAPRALSFPTHLQPHLRQLLAALPRCPKLYDSLNEHSRLQLQELLSVLRRRCATAAAAGAAPAVHGARAAAATRRLLGDGRLGSQRPVAAAAGAGYQRPGSGGHTAHVGPWIRAALEASRLRLQPPTSSVPPTQLVDAAAAPPAQDPASAVAEPAWRTSPGSVIVPQAGVPYRVTRMLEEKQAAGGGGDEGPMPRYPSDSGKADGDAHGDVSNMGAERDAGWWWIPDLGMNLDMDLDRTSRIHPQDKDDGQNPDLGPDHDLGASVPAMLPAALATPGAHVDNVNVRRRRRQDRSGSGLSHAERPSKALVSELGRVREEREATFTADMDTGDVARKGTEKEDKEQQQLEVTEEEAEMAVQDPPAKRPRTGVTVVAAVAENGTTAAVTARGGPKVNLEVLRALQEAVDGSDGGGGGTAAPLEALWRQLETLLEQCAAASGTAAAVVLPYTVMGLKHISDGDGIDGCSAVAALSPDAVRLIVRQLLTPRLSGAAARLLLSIVVLPVVTAVERVMPRALQEALAAAAAGPHPRPLTEAVLIPAVQRPQLTPGQAQLLVKAVTAGRPPLPPPLQALLLRAASAWGSQWGDPHVAVVQGLLEAAGEGLDQDTLGLICQGLYAAVRNPNYHNHHNQPDMTRSVPLCRLLLSLLTKYGNHLCLVQLRQLQEAAGATSTFMTKPCMAKLQELTTTATGPAEVGAIGGGAGAAWDLRGEERDGL